MSIAPASSNPCAVGAELLLDTGALVSLLDRSQKQHAACARFFDEWDRPVVSTEAVLTEATHLLGDLEGGRQSQIASRRWQDRWLRSCGQIGFFLHRVRSVAQ